MSPMERARALTLKLYSDARGFTVPPRQEIESMENAIAAALSAEHRAALEDALQAVEALKHDLDADMTHVSYGRYDVMVAENGAYFDAASAIRKLALGEPAHD